MFIIDLAAFEKMLETDENLGPAIKVKNDLYPLYLKSLCTY